MIEKPRVPGCAGRGRALVHDLCPESRPLLLSKWGQGLDGVEGLEGLEDQPHELARSDGKRMRKKIRVTNPNPEPGFVRLRGKTLRVPSRGALIIRTNKSWNPVVLGVFRLGRPVILAKQKVYVSGNKR